MFYVYVLKSLRNDKRYIGFTSKDPNGRLKEHNQGSNQFTRQNKPFCLVYHESYVGKSEAIIREKFLKSGKGRVLLDDLIKDSTVSARGGSASG